MTATQIPQTLGRRFQADQVLVRAHCVTTSLGRDLHSNDPIVIKCAARSALPDSFWGRLDHDVRALGGVWNVHLGNEDALVYLVRPFVSGATLAERLGRQRLLAHEVVDMSLAVTTALEQAHRVGVVHRGLRPSNLILSEAGEVDVVDFGLSRGALPVTTTEPSVDELLYLAPEQLGLIDRGVDHRADLYTLGLLIHQALTTQLPFPAPDTVAELLQQRFVGLPQLAQLALSEVPRVLEQIVSFLLHRDPRDRYQTAAGVRVDLERLRAALTERHPPPEIIVGAYDRRAVLTEPAFVGRDRELTLLKHAVRETRAGRGGVVFVEGEAGMGKTWLLNELARRAGFSAACTFRSQALTEGPQRPFQLLSAVARQLAVNLRGDEALRRAFLERLGPMVPAACELLPELCETLAVDGSALREKGTISAEHALLALTCVLQAIGTAERPTLLLLDDAQWSDARSLHSLRHMQELSATKGKLYVLAVLAFRGDEVPRGHPMHSIEPLVHVVLEPFGTRQVQQQIASMAGLLPAEVLALVGGHAKGNPLMVTAILQGLFEQGAITAGDEGWEVKPGALGALQVSAPLADILTSWLGRLSAGEQQVLTYGAVLGRRFDPALAAAIGGVSPSDVWRCIGASGRHFVWSDGSGTTCTFVHDRVRDVFLDRLSSTERRRLHRRAAEEIESKDARSVFELAYHFDAAGDGNRAWPYALAAAEQTRARFDLELAEHYYSMAARNCLAVDRQTRFRIARGHGEVLMMRNRCDEAHRLLTEARALAPDREALFDIEALFCHLMVKSFCLEEACEHGERALQHAGHYVPRSRLSCVPLCAWEALVQALHTLLPSLFVGRRPRAELSRDILQLQLLYALSGPYFHNRGIPWALWGHLRHLNRVQIL